MVGYAPVLITVYDRVRHLTDCVNSLAANKEARDSVLFVAVDYPSKREDEIKIQQVVDYCRTISGFKSVNLILRDYNHGAMQNYISALWEVLEKYPAVIILEDDNIVSPNFLEYMNGALAYYENDERIFSVCGFNFPVKVNSQTRNCYLWSAYNAYSSAFWKSKTDKSYWELNNFKHFLNNKQSVDGSG